MPLYLHDDPAESFRSLDSLLREILRGLLPETAAVVRFRADGEFLRAELPEGLGRTQALLVLQTEETVSSLLNEGRLVACLLYTSGAARPQSRNTIRRSS